VTITAHSTLLLRALATPKEQTCNGNGPMVVCPNALQLYSFQAGFDPSFSHGIEMGLLPPV
jgi:hypothetical protein